MWLSNEAEENETIKIRSEFGLPFPQFGTWLNMNFVYCQVFCLLLDSPKGR